MALNETHVVGEKIYAADINALADAINTLQDQLANLPATVANILDDYLPANSYYPDALYNDGDPVPTSYPNGTKLFALEAGVGQPVFTQVAAAPLTTDGTSFATTAIPAAPGANSFVFLHVHADAASGAAAYPTSVTGGGTTWTAVPNCSRTNGAGNGASRVYVSAASPTGGVVTMTYAATMGNVIYRAVQVDNLDATMPVKQANAMTFTNQAPAVPLDGVDPGNPMLGFYHAQSGGQSATIGDGYTQLGNQISNNVDAPVFLTDAEYRLDGVGSVNWAAGGTAQKIICALELNAA